MASVFHDKLSGRYRIRFRYGAREFNRSLKTADRYEAQAVLGRVEETLRLLERGRLEMPPHAEPGSFIVSDGKLNGKPTIPKVRTLDDLIRIYRANLPSGAKELTTLAGEDIHIRHLKRHLKLSRDIHGLAPSDLQAYIEARLLDRWRGKPIKPETVKKELTTFRLIWNWALEQGYITRPAPTRGLKYPKTDQKQPFMTWDEIQRIVRRSELTKNQEDELWKSLFLTTVQIDEVLSEVKQRAKHPFIYPMFVFVAHTGARRSEILRSQVDDFDFASRTLLVREKKKSKSKSLTFRRVPLTDLLCDTMIEWFAHHPGGQFAICEDLDSLRGNRGHGHALLNSHAARYHFKRTLKGSKWEKIKGFHVFRHSFASNLAAAGVDQRVIDEWMGHQTEEMRRRYRHLFPDQQREAIDSVFGGNGQ